MQTLRMLVKISYHGGQFMGFQVQHHERTVQYEFERILKRMHQTFVRIHPSSRTDKGVHAIEQYFHFDTHLNIAPDRWMYAFNSALPKDIYVQSVEQIKDDFHCRYDCVGKKYRYKVYIDEAKHIFEHDTKVQQKKPVNIQEMKEAAKHFLGTHDFTSFCSQKTEVQNKIRTIYQSEVNETQDGFEFVVTGSGFLYNMVRVMVAYLILVGEEKRSGNEIHTLLEERDRKKIPHTAPAHGLYLEKIYLDKEELINEFGRNIEIYNKNSSENV